MDRRTKFILLIVGSVILFGLVIWLIVWPTLAPLFPGKPVEQPPGLPSGLTPPVITPGGKTGAGGQNGTGSPGTGITTFQPSTTVTPEQQQILELSRRAGVLAERVESGSSANGFSNFDDAALGASPGLAQALRSMQSELRKKYPATGPVYFTIARRLVEKPQSDTALGESTFNVTVQLQIQASEAGKTSTLYREASVTFTKSGDEWIASGYTAKSFTP